jgi:hypothetical protein
MPEGQELLPAGGGRSPPGADAGQRQDRARPRVLATARNMVPGSDLPCHSQTRPARPGRRPRTAGRRAGGPGRVRSPAWAAAAGAVRSPGRGRRRPGGRTVPGRVGGRRRDRDSRPLRSITSVERCPALHQWDDARRCAWNGSWNGAAGIPAPPVLSVRFPLPSVQLLRTVRDAVVMVRRRSTVRFRNGLQVMGNFSNGSNERRGTSPGDALHLPLQRKLP